MSKPGQRDNGLPALWIKRLALFESQGKKETPIRDVPFHRGLNIVWGVELPDDAGANGAHPVTLSGHSVGKTTLCRMIRYCLGESTFGNPGATSRIRHAFPEGWAGMELVLCGQEWAVLRPIGHSGNSMAARAIRIENLFELEHRESKYGQFVDNLDNALMLELRSNSPPDSDRPYQWRHLLAWLTRDQESRFQSLHEWRSPRSGADTPRLQKPKEHALYLIRLFLDLVQEKELQLSSKIRDGERELKERETRIAELRQEPEYRFNEQENALKRMIGVPLDGVLNASLSDLTSPVFAQKTMIKDTIAAIRGDVEKIDIEIAEKRFWLASYDEKRRIFKAVLDSTLEGTESKEDQKQEDSTIRKLRELRGKDCDYGAIPFRECSYLQDRLAKAEKIRDIQKAREDRRVASETELRMNILEQQRMDHDRIVSLLDELRKKLNSDISEKHSKETELAGYRERLHRLENHLGERQRALDLLEGRTLNTPLQEETIRVDKLREAIERDKQQLDSLHTLYKKHLQSIEAVYNDLVKRALSDTYSGVLRMPKGELQFQIEEETGLSGEAVETLALVLADVAVMMCSCQGIGHHPRFLLHDSPREADLDRHIYNRYLRAMWALTEESGGTAEAPFQYIVTTTTRPPEDLESAICLQLEAHPENKMLFGRLLANRPTEDQLSIFGEIRSDEGSML